MQGIRIMTNLEIIGNKIIFHVSVTKCPDTFFMAQLFYGCQIPRLFSELASYDLDLAKPLLVKHCFLHHDPICHFHVE